MSKINKGISIGNSEKFRISWGMKVNFSYSSLCKTIIVKELEILKLVTKLGNANILIETELPCVNCDVI